MGVLIGVVVIAAVVALALLAPRLAGGQDLAGLGDPEDDERLICPHCHERGCVASRRMLVKRGISGGKATGAVLTGGISLLATGLARKEWTTRMWCGNCNTAWDV